ncbi:hypothetical protein M2D63_013620 [Pseudomonas sp. BJa5]|uniref:hypothetical protein n=1 Tax=Pseudomonas sp. BJa5 TaxID=2936270 RepID=UPI002559DCE3|nr:hypothetical protein [Pseudomonas sp. BGr12]MDL2422155.1 hypothetical protein [Pseudomonas sp. BGr12]
MSTSTQNAPTVTFDPARPEVGATVTVRSPHIRGLTGLQFHMNETVKQVTVVPDAQGGFVFTMPDIVGGVLVVSWFDGGASSPLSNLIVDAKKHQH